MEDSSIHSSPDLPFLVIHWLSHFQGAPRNARSHRQIQEDRAAQNDAIDRIQRATKDLADAFADLGAFGVTLNSPLGGSMTNQLNEEKSESAFLRNANYNDLAGRWASVSNRQLEALVSASTAATSAVLNDSSTFTSQCSLLDIAKDREKNALPTTTEPSTNLGNAVVDQDCIVPSVLLKPVLLQKMDDGDAKDEKIPHATFDHSSNRDMLPQLSKAKLVVSSDFRRIQYLTSQAMKRYLSIRKKYLEEEMTMRQIQRSLAYQSRLKIQVEKDITNLLTSDCAGIGIEDDKLDDKRRLKSDELSQKKLENERVVAQLGRKLEEIQTCHCSETKNELKLSESVVKSLWRESVSMESSYMDPCRTGTAGFHSNSRLHGRKMNSILNHVVARGYGVGIKRRNGSLRQRIGSVIPTKDIAQRSKILFSSRLSHALTVNAHLFCPVYCLRFDRTGRYFVTGADDSLVKLFRIGTNISPDSSELHRYHTSNPNFSCHRGAVLVCTFRGHAGVITDIDVSIDNALLATASEDGDVRIWAMSDGCPVAILRGHEGGANMVAWSHITPYQLVSVSDDGLARIWDVREAALKRCKSTRSRRDYNDLKMSAENVAEVENDGQFNSDHAAPRFQSSIQGDSDIVQEASNAREESSGNDNIYVPPLPAGAEFGVGAEIVDRNATENEGTIPGAFVANDELDEGVILLSRFQHGDLPDSSIVQGPGTRSRRKKIKVICLSRCPIGGHFATGSDDGIGRIWLDNTNDAIEKLDRELVGCDMSDTEYKANSNEGQLHDTLQRTRSSCREINNAPSTSSLLASLHGHHNEITDIKYSYNGDRLLTASQKDGVVRVWSWGVEASKTSDGNRKIEQIKQIFIRMEPPNYLLQRTGTTTDNMPRNRRGGGNSSSSKSQIQTRCDVAIWTTDDSRVITSQSSVSKASDTDIIPGSHVLYVWDSTTGDCLIGIPGSHDKPCPVLLSHPFDSSILVCAGSDGFAKVWDLDEGKCIFSHQNIHSFGALDNPADHGKCCAYLDGSFSPDGLTIILTDDKGRLSIIDVLNSVENAASIKDKDNQTCNDVAPSWMQEQYFANDYYDLFYDRNGYCVERGSRLPPHLAPEAARCMHTGHPYPEPIQRAFAMVQGPLPIPEDTIANYRHSLRKKGRSVRKQNGLLVRNVYGKRHLIEARANLAAYVYENSLPLPTCNHAAVDESSGQEAPIRPAVTRRNMSTNYRWIDFDDNERDEDDDEQDSDDEEYEERNTLHINDDAELDYLELDDYEPRDRRRSDRSRGSIHSPTSRRNRNRTRTRPNSRQIESPSRVRHRNEPTRTSSRQISRRNDSLYIYSSDDSDLEEVLTSNSSPCGEYVKDYTERGHLYKLPSGASVHKKWVTRVDCVLGYTGWKTYSPQVGDKVVYIPKAHAETLKSYPICEMASGAPWKSWPKNTPWPMVECEVKAIRYRFPYNGYLGTKSRNQIHSVVAIVTLEILGVPASSQHQNVPWVHPNFIPRPSTRSIRSTFEVSIFENSEADFILPMGLFKWRVEALELAIEEHGSSSGIKLTDFFVNTEAEDSKFDPYSCELFTTIPDEESELHFQGSGYNAVQLTYEGSNNSVANAWDVTVSGKEDQCPLPTCLTDEQTLALISIIDSLESDEYIKSAFSAPVDTRRFIDYEQVIEVPIDLSLIKRRLEQKYYTNVHSVLADMKLLRDNCFKYNKEDSDITKEVQNMFQNFQASFKEKMDMIGYDAGERESSMEFDTALRSIKTQRRSSRRQTAQHPGSPIAESTGGGQPTHMSARSLRSARRNNGTMPTNAPVLLSRVSREINLPRDQNSPRIRINTRFMRQQQEHSAVQHNTVQGSNSSDDIFDPSRMSFSVVLNGMHYTCSDSDSDSKSDTSHDDSEIMHNHIRQKATRTLRASNRVGTSDGSPGVKRRQSSRLFDKKVKDESSEEDSCDEDDEHGLDLEDQDEGNNRRPRSSRYFGKKSKAECSEEEYSDECKVCESDSDNQDEEVNSIVNPASTRVGPRHTRSSSRRQGHDQNQVESLQETFNRRRTRTRSSGTDDSSSAHRRRRGRNSMGIPSALETLPEPSSITPSNTRTSLRRKQNGVSYEEYPSSEFEDDDESDALETETKKQTKLSGKKRPRAAEIKVESPKKKVKVPKRQEDMKLPHIEKWPGHIVKPNLLKDVCIAIIDRVALFDAEGLFHTPVLEQYPEVAQKYLEKVENPIDLRTIRNERVPNYRVVGELQDDLILMLQNCCTFNRVNSEYWKYAVEIWQNLNEIFVETLKDLGLGLPRRFGL